MNQLKPVLIEDFNEIKSPSSLQYSPDEKTLAFTLVQPDKENNKYSKVIFLCKSLLKNSVYFNGDESILEHIKYYLAFSLLNAKYSHSYLHRIYFSV